MAALLRLRKLQENRALGELSRVLQRYNEQEDRIQEARRLVEQEENDLFRTGQQYQNFHLIQSHSRYLDRLEDQMRRATQKMEEIRPELEAEQKKVTDAARQRRVVEMLEEKYRERYDYERRKEERKQLEEQNAIRKGLPGFEEESPGDDDTEQYTDRQEDPGDAELSSRNEEGRPEKKSDAISDYFESLGMEDPRKKRK